VSAGELHHLQSLVPNGVFEKATWLVLSVSAAFREEFIDRGYLQQQFHRLAGRLSTAVVLQALVFGAAHLALPREIAVSVMFLGMLLGGLAA